MFYSVTQSFLNFLRIRLEVCVFARAVKLKSPCTLCIAVEAKGIPIKGVRNDRKDDDGFEYLRNWLIFVVTVASWILYVANGRKINSLSGNILTKIITFRFK
jgi:hypothetical protein